MYWAANSAWGDHLFLFLHLFALLNFVRPRFFFSYLCFEPRFRQSTFHRVIINTVQQNLLKAMLNNPEKTSTAWSKLPEPSNQSYLASKYSKANWTFTLFAFHSCFLRKTVSSRTWNWHIVLVGTVAVFRRQLFKSPFFAVIISFRHYFVPLTGSLFIVITWFFFWTLLCVLLAQWPQNARSTNPLLLKQTLKEQVSNQRCS